MRRMIQRAPGWERWIDGQIGRPYIGAGGGAGFDCEGLGAAADCIPLS